MRKWISLFLLKSAIRFSELCSEITHNKIRSPFREHFQLSQCEVSNPVPLTSPLITGQWSSKSSWELRKPLALLFFNSVRNLGTIKTEGAFPLTSKSASSGTEASLQINTWGALLTETALVILGWGELFISFHTDSVQNLSKGFHFAAFLSLVCFFLFHVSHLWASVHFQDCGKLSKLGNSPLRQVGREVAVWSPLCSTHSVND